MDRWFSVGLFGFLQAHVLSWWPRNPLHGGTAHAPNVSNVFASCKASWCQRQKKTLNSLGGSGFLWGHDHSVGFIFYFILCLFLFLFYFSIKELDSKAAPKGQLLDLEEERSKMEEELKIHVPRVRLGSQGLEVKNPFHKTDDDALSLSLILWFPIHDELHLFLYDPTGKNSKTPVFYCFKRLKNEIFCFLQ